MSGLSYDFYNETFLNRKNYRDFTFKSDGRQQDLGRGYEQAKLNNLNVAQDVGNSKVFWELYKCRSTPVPNVYSENPVYNGNDDSNDFFFAEKRRLN